MCSFCFRPSFLETYFAYIWNKAVESFDESIREFVIFAHEVVFVSIVVTCHDLVAAHVTRLDEAERVVDTQGRKHANVTKVFRPLHVRRRNIKWNASSNSDDRVRLEAGQLR